MNMKAGLQIPLGFKIGSSLSFGIILPLILIAAQWAGAHNKQAKSIPECKVGQAGICLAKRSFPILSCRHPGVMQSDEGLRGGRIRPQALLHLRGGAGDQQGVKREEDNDDGDEVDDNDEDGDEEGEDEEEEEEDDDDEGDVEMESQEAAQQEDVPEVLDDRAVFEDLLQVHARPPKKAIFA